MEHGEQYKHQPVDLLKRLRQQGLLRALTEYELRGAPDDSFIDMVVEDKMQDGEDIHGAPVRVSGVAYIYENTDKGFVVGDTAYDVSADLNYAAMDVEEIDGQRRVLLMMMGSDENSTTYGFLASELRECVVHNQPRQPLDSKTVVRKLFDIRNFSSNFLVNQSFYNYDRDDQEEQYGGVLNKQSAVVERHVKNRLLSVVCDGYFQTADDEDLNWELRNRGTYMARPIGYFAGIVLPEFMQAGGEHAQPVRNRTQFTISGGEPCMAIYSPAKKLMYFVPLHGIHEVRDAM